MASMAWRRLTKLAHPHRAERDQMRFILVNGRAPCPQPICVKCEKPISARYLREIGTHLIYCNHDCYADHCNGVIQLLESRIKLS
jgi:hypothetical protein